MTLNKISLARTYNIGNYEALKLELEFVRDERETIHLEKTFETLRQELDSQAKRLYPNRKISFQ